MLIGINYHYIREDFNEMYPSIFGMTTKEFTRQLELLSRGGEFVSAEDISAAVQNGRRLPGRSWVLTFDDGLKEQFENAWPILSHMGIPAIFFVNSDPIENKSVSTIHKIHLTRAKIEPMKFYDAFKEEAKKVRCGSRQNRHQRYA